MTDGAAPDLGRPVAAALADRLDDLAPRRLGVAVSGGSDSTALLLAAADWRDRTPGARLRCATVDHRLRPESATEAAGVRALCARLRVPCDVLVWDRGPNSGNLAEAAREARADLLSAWAARRRLGAVALGHTRDDRAETLLMRLARGSGLDGLAAMRARSVRAGAVWIRPALDLGRAELRAFVAARGVGWVEDPSNDDLSRDRPKARAALAALAPLGLTVEGLAATAVRLAEDSDAAAGLAARWLAGVGRVGAAGELRLDRAAWRAGPPALRRRALARLLRGLSGAPHPPRRASLEALDAVLTGEERAGRTLHGAQIVARGRLIVMHREAAAPAARSVNPAAGTVEWDGRWRLAWDSAALSPDRVGPLGAAGLSAIAALPAGPRPRFVAAPHAARAASPALFAGERLLSAPLAGHGPATAEDALAALLAPERAAAHDPESAPPDTSRGRP